MSYSSPKTSLTGQSSSLRVENLRETSPSLLLLLDGCQTYSGGADLTSCKQEMAEAVCECRSRSPPFSRPAEPGWAKAVCIFKQFSNMHLQQRGSRENSLCRLGFTYTKSVSWVGVLFRGRAVNGTNPGCYVHINNCAVMVVVLAQTQATVDLPTRHRPWTHGQNNKGVAPGPLMNARLNIYEGAPALHIQPDGVWEVLQRRMGETARKRAELVTAD